MRFLIDMPLSPGVGAWLVQRVHDAIQAGRIGLSSSADSKILERARIEGRVVITADLVYRAFWL